MLILYHIVRGNCARSAKKMRQSKQTGALSDQVDWRHQLLKWQTRVIAQFSSGMQTEVQQNRDYAHL